MKQNPILDKIEAEQVRTLEPFNVGDTVRVHNKIKEGNRERIQMFEGTVMKIQNGGLRKNLKPGEAPKAEFVLAEGDEVVAVYEYCNLHGLWKK